jgi:hypothetical protein
MNQSRIDARARVFLAAAQRDGRSISADARVGLRYACQLAGLSYSRVRELAREGRGPRICRLGMGSDKQTVSLLDLSEWIESRFES